MTRTAGVRFETESLTTAHWLAVLLALATGVIHVYAGVVEGRIPLSLAGLGFFGAVALFLADYRRPLLYLAGVLYTGVQIPLWYAVKAGEYTTVGYADKALQVALVVVLAYLYWSDRRTAARGSESPTA